MNLPDLLLGRQEIKELLAEYSILASRRRWTELVNLFATDGVFAATLPLGGVVERKGREEILKFLVAQNVRVFAMICNEIVKFEGDEASATCAVMSPVGPAEDGRGFAGFYEDRFVKEAGQWRFKRRLFELYAGSLG